MTTNKTYLGEGGRFFLREDNGLIDYDMLDFTEHGRLFKKSIEEFAKEMIMAPSIYDSIFTKEKISPKRRRRKNDN